jgi:hypothetical protein
LCEEGRKMDWIVGDVVRTHGNAANLECLFPPSPCKTGNVDGCLPPKMLPAPVAPQPPEVIPAPKGLPQGVPSTTSPQGKTPAVAPGATLGARQNQGPVMILNSRPAAQPISATPVATAPVQAGVPTAPGMAVPPATPAPTGTMQPPIVHTNPVQPTSYAPGMTAPPTAPMPSPTMPVPYSGPAQPMMNVPPSGWAQPGVPGQPTTTMPPTGTWATPNTYGQPNAPAPPSVPRQGEPNLSVAPTPVWAPQPAVPMTAPGVPNDPRKESNRWQPYPER